MRGRVLIIAGSDSGGGAGIQADIKTVTALGGYAATAITALTAQNTEAVLGIEPVEPGFVRLQMDAVLRDIGADSLKIGMLHDRAIIDAVADGIESAAAIPLVLDPVMIASSGAALLEDRAIEVLKQRLVRRTRVLTPNAPEAERLSGTRVASFDEMRRAAEILLRMGAKNIVLKGGHLPGPVLRDLVIGEEGEFVLEAQRVETRATHGTGCTLASAIATGLAQGMALKPAAERAHRFVQLAIRAAPGFGRGHGPLDHAHAIPEFPPRRGPT